jgi:hypothetical protein
MTNDLLQRAKKFQKRYWTSGEYIGHLETEAARMRDFAAAEIARERAEIVAGLDAIGKRETCYADYSDAIGDYIETLRAKL